MAISAERVPPPGLGGLARDPSDMVITRPKRAEWVYVLSVLAVGLLLRVFWVSAFPMEPTSDYLTLLRLARVIAEGQWRTSAFGWNFHGHGFPLVLAPVLFVADRLEAVHVATTLMQFGMVIAVWWLARSLFGPRAGLAAAACAACLPGLWMLTPLVAKENLSILLLPLWLALTWRAQRPGRALAAGLTFALLSITRANFLPFIPVAALLTLMGAAPGYRRRALAWFAAGTGLLLVPVIFLNVLHGGWPLPTAAGSQQVWVVHNERWTGRHFAWDSFDDSPFLGFETWDQRLPIMRKLGLQFVAANPAVALANTWMRHEAQWSSDSAGLEWTYNRATPEMQARVPLAARPLRRLVDGLFVLLLVLALVGAVRGGGRAGVAPLLALPLLYGFMTLALSSISSRYHVTFTPLLCVLAGAAVMPWPPRSVSPNADIPPAKAPLLRWPPESTVWRSWSIRLGLALVGAGLLVAVIAPLTGTALSYDAVIRGQWSGWLVVAIAVVLVAHPVIQWGPCVVQALAAAAARRPGRATAALAALAGVGLLGTVFVLGQTAAMVAAVGAVAPQGWERYQQDETGELTGLPLQLVSAGMPGHLRQVSYPDGVQLEFEGIPQPGTVAGLRRELLGLDEGETYTFYLHVFDPGSEGDPGEALVVRLNDRVLWQRASGTAEAAGWHYVVVEWVADAESAAISVERTAGPASGQPNHLVPIIRTLHLYPEY